MPACVNARSSARLCLPYYYPLEAIVHCERYPNKLTNKFSRQAGLDRWQHVLESLVRVEQCLGYDMTPRLEVLTMLEMLRRLTGARDMATPTLILDG